MNNNTLAPTEVSSAPPHPFPDRTTAAGRAAIRKIVDGLFFLPDGALLNLRTLRHSGKGMRSQFFRDKKRLAEAVINSDSKDIKAQFVQIQQIKPDAKFAPGKGVTDSDIFTYRWLVFDIDTIRPDKSTSSATTDEKKKSWQVAMVVYDYLRDRGWSEGAICDSGNGWHLWFRVQLDNTVENYALLENCLTAVAAKFSNEHAEIDTSLADPGQVIKVYGSVVRKSRESTLERPWRTATVVRKPETFELVSLEQLQALAAEAPAEEKSTRSETRSGAGLVEGFDVYDFADHYDLEIIGKEEKADATYYHLSDCPFNDGPHKNGDDKTHTALIVGNTLGFRCFSDDCDRYTIANLLRHLRQEHGKYPKPIWKKDKAQKQRTVKAAQSAEQEPEQAENQGRPKWSNLFDDLQNLEDAPLPMLIDGVLFDGATMMIGGLPGSGKSWLALDMAASLVTQRKLFGNFDVPEPVNVIYLIPEVNARAMRRRLKTLGILEHVNSRLFVRTLSKGQTLDLRDESLLQAIRDLKPLVILDTAIRFSNAKDENSAAEIAKLSKDITDLKVAGARAVIGLHHSPKRTRRQGQSLENALRGSGDFAANSDIVLSLTMKESRHQLKEEDPMQITVVFEKDREDIAKQKSFTIAGRPYLDTKGHFVMIDNTGVAAKQVEKQEEEQVLAQYIEAHRSATYGKIVAALGISKGRIGSLAARIGWRKKGEEWEQTGVVMGRKESDPNDPFWSEKLA